jgi:hypothetical protein
MKTLQDIVDYVHLRMNKDQSGMSISPDKWTNIFQVVNMEYLKLKLGLPEEYQAMSFFPRQAYQITKRLQDDTRFLVTPIPLTSQNGVFDLPSDYVYLSSITYEHIYNNHRGVLIKDINNIELLSDMDFSARVSSSLMYPTHKTPIGRFLSGAVEIAPTKINKIKLVYVRKPNDPVYAFTVNSNDEYVYNPADSVDFEWPDICIPDIANMVLSYVSDNFRDMFIKQSSENRKAQGK